MTDPPRGRHGPGEDETTAGLLDRHGEIATLRRLAAGARDGRAGMVCLQGTAGIGKTALLDLWISQSRAGGLRVLHASCAEMAADFPFSVVRQLFRPVVDAASEGEREALLEGPASLASRALAVDVDQVPGELPQDASFALLHGLCWFLVNLAESGPLVIAVDDVHWCDLPSLRWLSYLSRRLEGLPVLLVLAERTGESHRTSGLLTEYAARPDCSVIRLGPLSDRNVARLVRGALGADADQRFCLACGDASEGNPLLLAELLRTLAGNRVPPRAEHAHRVEEYRGHVLARTVVQRLDQQPRDTVALARALALLGDGASTQVAAELAGLTALEAAEHVVRLHRLGVLRAGTPLWFEHPLIRAAIASAAMTPADLAAGSARAARILYEDGAPSERVASHLLRCAPFAGGWPVVDVLRDAARTARARGAPDAAARYLSRALDEPLGERDRGGLLVELGTSELMRRPGDAADHLSAGLAATTGPAARGRAAALLATALLLAQCGPDAVTVLQRAVAELMEVPGSGTGPLRELILHLEAQLIQVAYEDLSTVEVVTERIRRLPPAWLGGDTPGERALLAALTLYGMAGHMSAERTAELADRAYRSGLPLGGPAGVLFALATIGFIACDRLAEAAELFEDMAAQAVRGGSLRMSILASYGRASIAARKGDVTDALAQAEALLERAPSDLGYSTLPIAALVVNALVDLGDLDAADEVLAANRSFDVSQPIWDRGPFLLARGRLDLARGDAAGALAALLECGRNYDAAGLTNPAVMPWRSQAALAYAALGRRDAAIDIAARELDLSRRWGTPRAVGVSLRCLGLVTGGEAEFGLLAEAVDELERSPARLDLARALHGLGAAQTRAGQTGPARTTLRRAFDLAGLCGAGAVVEEIRSAMRAAGARPGRARPTGTRGLTPSEYQVATMAAQGLTNRAIAQALFVTPRTVEVHLTSSYRKLEIAGRGELRNALRPLIPAPADPGSR